jgi:signal transduction histidine kinase
MDATIGALREMLERVIREDITLTFDLDGKAEVLIDPNDLEQAVFNLVINARDALPDGGAIHVGISQATLDASAIPSDAAARPGDYVRLSVRDNGTGMTPEIVARLFEPFFTTKEVGVGTGLGLPFVHGIARHAGGFVTIDTAPGQGTTVSVLVPVARADGVPAPAPRPAPPFDCSRHRRCRAA